MASSTVSPRSRLVTFLLGMFTGVFGGHRFYVGKNGTGVAMIFTLGGMGLWWLVDMIMIATGEFRDLEGRRVVSWMVDEELLSAGAPKANRVTEELETMRQELFELQERVDFMERTFSQVRQGQRHAE